MQNIWGFFRQFNWIDILVIILTLRIVFVSFKFGLETEFFKFLGTFFGLYLALHYYFSLAVYLNGRTGAKSSPGEFLEFSSYIFLLIFGYLIFWLFRLLIFKFINAQINLILSKWLGFILGLCRAWLLCSIILLGFLIPQSVYFKDSVRYSLSGKELVKVAPAVYTWTWKSIVSKFNFGGKFNNAILEINSSETKQIKKNK